MRSLRPQAINDPFFSLAVNLLYFLEDFQRADFLL
jgi:hypothetical protein